MQPFVLLDVLNKEYYSSSVCKDDNFDAVDFSECPEEVLRFF